jgi:sigma-B regulation protein RsbU (phosphoserine phosphatase)
MIRGKTESSQTNLRQQVEIARRLQDAFLPKTCPTCKGITAAARHVMSDGVGGDLHDFVRSSDGHYALVVGDVEGHGLVAALVMSLLFGTVHSADLATESAADVLKRANDLLGELNDQLRSEPVLCSLFFGSVDPQRHALRYANAGHPPPLLWRHDGRLERLNPTGGLLGLEPGAGYALGAIDLRGARRLLFYTDGVTEARDSHGRFFGESALIESVAAQADVPVETAIDRTISAVLSFAGGRLQDDATLVLVEFSSSWSQAAD